jgi:hypothetical protein
MWHVTPASALNGKWLQPVTGSHTSSEQAWPSSHDAALGWQIPVMQAAGPGQTALLAHGVPSGRA